MLRKLNFEVFCTAALVLFAAFGTFAQTARTEAVTVGEIAPDFTLSDNAGKKVTLSQAVRVRPAILRFSSFSLKIAESQV